MRCAYHRESFPSSLWKHVHSQEIPLAQVALVNVVFARGAMVSGDTCLIVKNWTFLPARHWRRCRWFKRFRPSRRAARDEKTSSLQPGQSASTDIDAIGDVRLHPSTENGRLVFWHSLPVPRLPRGLPSWTIPILILLHPSFLLSLNSRRATARTFPVTFLSLSSTSLGLLPFLSSRGCSLLRALLRTLLRSRRFETASGAHL